MIPYQNKSQLSSQSWSAFTAMFSQRTEATLRETCGENCTTLLAGPASLPQSQGGACYKRQKRSCKSGRGGKRNRVGERGCMWERRLCLRGKGSGMRGAAWLAWRDSACLEGRSGSKGEAPDRCRRPGRAGQARREGRAQVLRFKRGM